MATKYCDHGVYNNAVFVASTSGSSTTLTVASITSGCLSQGQFITGTGITAAESPVLGTYITAVTYNAANVVTSVTMSASMTVAAGTTITASYGEPASVPLWGQAQDGDGTVSTPATPSTVEVVFTGVPSSGVIAVLGITVSVAWATSANNCADLLATAINTLATVATGPASFVVKGPVRNHLYARGPSTGAPAGTCQIMTRQGAAAHAGLIAVTHTLNNVSSAATINFAGGSGGAWGYAFKNWNYSFWPTTSTICGPMSGGSYCGGMIPGDTVVLRAGKVIPFYYTGTISFGAGIGSAASPVDFVIDDSTVWSDGAEPVFVVDGQLYDNAVITPLFTGNTTAFYTFSAKQYASGVRSFKFVSRVYYYVAVGYGHVIRPASGLCILSNLHFENTTNMGSVSIAWATYYAFNQTSATFNNCYLKNRATSPFLKAGSDTALCDLTLNGCEFEYTGSSLITLMAGNNYGVWLYINGLKLTGFLTGSTLITLGTSGIDLCMVNCDFGGVTLRGPYYSAFTVGNGDAYPYIAISSMDSYGDFSVDTKTGFCEWNHLLGFPVRSATLLDGVTAWSIRVIPNRAAQLKATRYLSIPPLHKINSLATAARTITVHVLVDTTLTPTYYKSDVWIVVSYIGGDGSKKTIGQPGSYTTLLESDDSATWDKTTFVSGGTLNYDKRKVSITTPTSILTDSLFAVNVCIGKSVANATQFLFVCPDVEIT